ncbi:MAG: hypothetical protein JNL21_15975 [Myxococcales bacterium]|nr:hypothetical protein [Myxococcales bacterium]
MTLRPLALLSLLLLVPGVALAADKATCVQAYEEGQKQRASGSLKASLELFRVCSEADCPVATKKDCTVWLSEVEVSLPTVVLSAVDAGGKDLVDVRVKLDGQPLTSRLDGKALVIDPGKRSLVFERDGAAPITREIVVKQGEKDRKVEVSWAEAETTAPEVGGGNGISISPGTWVLGGIGLAGLTLFGVFGGLALMDKSDAKDTCAPECSDSTVGSIRTKLIVADVSLGVGVASLGAAVVLGVVSALDGGETEPKQAAWSFGVAPTEGGAVGVVGGVF